MALNEASDNSVMAQPGSGSVPADGTGRSCSSFKENFANGAGVIQLDPWLSPFRDALRSRYSHAQRWIKTINETEGGLEKFSKGYEKFGFQVQSNGDTIYREWAPNATKAFLIGDFSESTNETIVRNLGVDTYWQTIGIETAMR